MKFKDMEVGMRVVVVKESKSPCGSCSGRFFVKGNVGTILRLLDKDEVGPAGAHVAFDGYPKPELEIHSPYYFAQAAELSPYDG